MVVGDLSKGPLCAGRREGQALLLWHPPAAPPPQSAEL